MRNNNSPLFDSEFALTQFSGNASLLNKMLDKFCEQYATLSQQVVASLEENDLTTVKSSVHTVKGVSGNLGMKALHQASRDFETHLQQSNPADSEVADFNTTLHDTLSAIKQFKDGAVDQDSVPETNKSGQQDARQSLLEALKSNEFITQTKLEGWLTAIALPEEVLQRLEKAIDELEYDTAISLLE